MFNYLKRKKYKQRDPLPGWVKWAVVAFIAYTIVTGPKKQSEIADSADTDTKSASIGEVADKKLSQYKSIYNKMGIIMRTEILSPGSGEPVLCGQDLVIDYEIFSEAGVPTGERHKGFRMRLGAGEASVALEQGISGIKIGEKRRIIARKSLVYGSENKDASDEKKFRIDVTLISATPDVTRLRQELFRIADTTPGSGNIITCGQSVPIHLTVWNMDGTKRFETKEPVMITPGASQTATGIEQGIIGMRLRGGRTLIIPPSLQKSLHGGKPVPSFSLPHSQTVVVDVYSR